ncbi:protein Sok1p [Diutina catenulata]
MNLNNQSDKQDHSDHPFRQVCFDQPSSTATAAAPAAPATKRNSSSSTASSSSSDQSKRVRLDPSLGQMDPLHGAASPKSFNQEFVVLQKQASLLDPTQTVLPSPQEAEKKPAAPEVPAANTATKSKPPRFIRRFRSRSLPIINYSQRSSSYKPSSARYPPSNAYPKGHHDMSSQIPPLPPINLQSLKEIDLHEILKNPQLRHDILFDPQLQFRPNLDGERGKRKKSIIDKYWLEIQKECRQFFDGGAPIKINRLPILFSTLRDVLLSLLPAKDRPQVTEIMDIELLIQQLNHGSFDFVEMARWLGDVFKSHCAPMRDQWVVEMIQKFSDAYRLSSVEYLVAGLRMIFQILEAMKLDVANHQIRILRPVLIGTAVDFEREYFQSLILHNKIYIDDSLNWFYKKFSKKRGGNDLSDAALKPVIISSIIDLLSCRQMATEFPSTLAFDHTRLVLLRADVRQLVCVQLCVVLYKQLVANAKKPASLVSASQIQRVQQEILSIVTDDNGNIKWTKNISAISLQLVKNVVAAPRSVASTSLPQNMVDFVYHWLIKHIQPSSPVYGPMESKVFKDLYAEIMLTIDEEAPTMGAATTAANNAASSAATTTTTITTPKADTSELKNIAQRISTLGKFHWSVFGSNYIEWIKLQQKDTSTNANVAPEARQNTFEDENMMSTGAGMTQVPQTIDEASTTTVITT